MVDTPASGAGVSNDMEVRALSRVPKKIETNLASIFFGFSK